MHEIIPVLRILGSKEIQGRHAGRKISILRAVGFKSQEQELSLAGNSTSGSKKRRSQFPLYKNQGRAKSWLWPIAMLKIRANEADERKRSGNRCTYEQCHDLASATDRLGTQYKE